MNYRKIYSPRTITENIVCDVVANELFDDYNHGDIHIKDRDEKGNFILRNGYWGHINEELIGLVEIISNTKINEVLIEDDDCSDLFVYEVTV